ncbi:MBOAT, membrane-bound O-acyltransferase family [Butyrivibrio sp. INlla14]|nr:MBOAT, membrane-bound O-acyltransferase family [Butyrivibrio sp. INlla14]
MTFNSYEFLLLFLPIFIIGFNWIKRVGRKKGKAQMLVDLWIVLGSLCFYGLFGMQNLGIILISLCLNACTAIPMAFMRDSRVRLHFGQKEIAPVHIWMAVGVITNLVLLLFFKLWGAFLPIAISFYTFNQISYIVDLGRGEIAEFSLLDYLSYILFFPKLLQGPLMGYGDYRQQVEAACEKSFDAEVVLRGLYLFSLGLFKKVIMADTLGKAVDYGYENLLGLGSIEAVLTAVFYSFQLYFDFSGYCDMASGVCMMMGLELPLNFNSPYKAVSIVDFWKRWHITLTKFFTKYLYIPLGGNRRGAGRMYLNFMIVFLLSGFWHGTGWNFIIWGAMHGVLFVVTMALGKNAHKDANQRKVVSWTGRNRNPERDGDRSAYFVVIRGISLRNLLGKLFTFIYVTAAWVFFRAENAGQAIGLFRQIFVGGIRKIGTGMSSIFQLDELWYVIKVTPLMRFGFVWELCLWIFLVGSVVMVFFCKNAQEKARERKIGLWTTLVTAFLLLWCIVSFGGVSTFLYMNF